MNPERTKFAGAGYSSAVQRRVLFIVMLQLVVAWSAFAGNGPIRKRPNAIRDEYIVVFEDTVRPEQVSGLARSLAAAHNGYVRAVWRDALRGFSVSMTEERAAALARNPNVKYVEEDAEMFLSGDVISTKVDPATCTSRGVGCTSTTDNRLWHLDRLSQSWASRDALNRSCATGQGIRIYVVDTGVVGSHHEFQAPGQASRVLTGVDATDDYNIPDSVDPDNLDLRMNYYPGNNPCRGWADEPGPHDATKFYAEVQGNGHGTAVASLAAGRISGVAPSATIVPVKVSRCERNSAREEKRSTFYSVGDAVFNVTPQGQIDKHWVCTSAGTTGSSEPSWPTGPSSTAREVNDNGVIWLERFTPSASLTVSMVVSGLNWIYGRPTSEKQNAVITMSTWEFASTTGVPGTDPSTLEGVVRLLANPSTGVKIPFVASANNQGGDACTTSPARLSRNNPDPTLRSKVITAGGTMIVNIPDGTDVPLSERPDGGTLIQATEPAYDASQPTLDARWICGAGDASNCTAAIQTKGAQAGSNGGACVTLFAPAKNLSVASNLSATSYRDPTRAPAVTVGRGAASGTSWSAPIVAGVIARIQQQNPGIDADGVYNTLMSNALINVIKDDATHPLNPPNVTDTPNVMLNLADVSITTPPSDQTSSTSSPATLTVTATGTGALSYQWYKVKDAFVQSNRRGATHPEASDVIAGATSATLSNLNPATRTGYWVRVVSGCAQVESDIVYVTPSTVTAPANVTATASGAVVTISWSTVQNATGYEIQRKVDGNAWAVASTVTGQSQSSGTDTPPSSSEGVVLYRVLALNGSAKSDPSNNDVAFVGAFTDPQITEYVTTVKAAHIIEMRRAVNGLLTILNSTPVYSGNALSDTYMQTQAVAAADWTTLMANLNSARGLGGMPAVGFTNAPAQSQPVDNLHIAELRDGVR